MDSNKSETAISLTPVGFTFINTQFSIGGQFIPNDQTTNAYEQYYLAQYSFDKIKNPQWSNAVSLANYRTGDCIFGITLERSSVVQLSGLPISSSRVLSARATMPLPGGTATRQIDMFMTYVKVAKVFLNRIIVRE
jgi:hypothetical protein